MIFDLIVPSYNERATLQKLLDIVTQIPEFKTIYIIDGGSNDGTDELINTYNDKRIDFISSSAYSLADTISPIAKARNVVLKKSQTGDVFFFVDLGCLYEIQSFQNIIKAMIEKGVDFAYVKTMAFITTPYSKRYSSVMIKTEKYYTNQHLPSSRFLAVKADTFMEIGGYNELAFAGEDTDFSLKLVKSYNGKMVPGQVLWIVPKTRREAMRKHFKYGFGDGSYKNNITTILFCLLFPFIPTKKEDFSFFFLEKIILRFCYGIGGGVALIRKK